MYDQDDHASEVQKLKFKEEIKENKIKGEKILHRPIWKEDEKINCTRACGGEDKDQKLCVANLLNACSVLV